MQQALTIELPMQIDAENGGYLVIDEYKEMVRQNFKHLLLTIPGEKIMNPDFGVGLSTFLFEPNLNSTYGDIISRIYSQVERYLPYVGLETVDVVPNDNPEYIDDIIAVRISYRIIPLGIDDILEIER